MKIKKELIVLSGNVGVGKSTIGPKLAQRLQAFWIPENTISSQFPYLLADPSLESKIIGEIAFASVRKASILSKFLSGENRIVSERYLWDDEIFFKMWIRETAFNSQDQFINEFFYHLNDHNLEFGIHTIYLRCKVNILSKRIEKRGEIYDNTYRPEVIQKIQDAYEEALEKKPSHLVADIDISDLEINNQEAINYLLNRIISVLP